MRSIYFSGLKTIFLILLFNFIYWVPTHSFASMGHEQGNGGGSWVCRETDGEIRWARLVDLFEASAQYPLKDSQGKTERQILDETLQTLNAIDSRLKASFQLRLERTQQAWVPVSQMKLEIIDDALYYGMPAPETCKMGNLAYEQTANFYPDGNIFVDSRITDAFSPEDKAALMIHEALYLMVREEKGDANSVRTRKLVGLLFSTKDASEISKFFSWFEPNPFVVFNWLKLKDSKDFHEGLAAILTDNGWGYINPLGSIVISDQFLQANSFSEGLATVQLKSGDWYTIDRTGKYLFKLNLIPTGNGEFHTGLLIGQAITHSSQSKTDSKSGAIDIQGNSKIPFEFDDIQSFDGNFALAKKAKKQGYINTQGQWMISPKWDQISFYNGTTAAACLKTRNNLMKCGVIDTHENWKIQPQFNSLSRMDSMRWVFQKGAHGGVLNQEGQMLWQIQADELDFKNPQLGFVKQGNTYHLIDDQGKIISSHSFSKINSIFNPEAPISVVMTGQSKCTFVNSQGLVYHPTLTFSECTNFQEERARVRNEATWTFISNEL